MMSWENILAEIKHNLTLPLAGKDAQLRMAPSHRGELFRNIEENRIIRQSAVLISLFIENDKINTLLIKRATYNGVHSGQVSFPGGKHEETDESLIYTALREAQEEIGIDPLKVKVLGTLTPLFIPVSNMEVLPVVGFLQEKPDLYPNLEEVEYTITIPICHLKNPNNHLRKTINIREHEIEAPYFKVDCEDVWGATAMIISEFIELFNC
jgi:8-oxo-dGTP pyrophosphatase MutT (NUDIX family)